MRNKGYFQGWYFKCSDGEKAVAFIPAYHRSRNVTSASLQIITDDAACHIPFEKLEYTEKPLSVKIGDCTFGEKASFEFEIADETAGALPQTPPKETF